MKALLSLIVLVYVCSNIVLGLNENFIKHLWNKYKKSHGKMYLSEEHENYRFSLFKKNMNLIEKHNTEYSMGLHTYTLGMNIFADWSFEEFKEKMLGTRTNLTFNKQGSSATFMRLPTAIQTPDNLDWRDEGAVTPVKNQGECGSCWAFSTTGSLEAAHFRLTGKLVSLSEQQLVDCSGKYHNDGCNGGLMDNAFQYIKENGGLDTEASYPYHAKQEKCHFSKKDVGSLCSGYVDIPSGDEDALKEAIATSGPVSVAIDVTEEKFMLYKDGIFVDDSCKNEQDDLNHGVLVIGYGTNTTIIDDTEKTMDFWIVKNSWSSKWGEKGYVRMARNYNNMCGIATSASYPLVKEAKTL